SEWVPEPSVPVFWINEKRGYNTKPPLLNTERYQRIAQELILPALNCLTCFQKFSELSTLKAFLCFRVKSLVNSSISGLKCCQALSHVAQPQLLATRKKKDCGSFLGLSTGYI